MTSDSAIAAQISALEDQRCAAMLAGDIDTLRTLLSPDLVYVHTSGDRDTKDSYLSQLQSRYVYYLHLHRENEAIVVQGDAAIATGRQIGLSVLNGAPGLIDSLYLAVWARGEAGWQFLAWHATRYSPTARV